MGPLSLVLPGKKLRHRDVKELAQGHTAGSPLQRLSSNPWATPFSTSLASGKGIDRGSCPEKCQNRGPDCPCPLGPLWVFPRSKCSGPLPPPALEGGPPGLRPPWRCRPWQPPLTAVATQQSFICQLNPSEPSGHGQVQLVEGGSDFLCTEHNGAAPSHDLSDERTCWLLVFHTEVHELFKTSPPPHRSPSPSSLPPSSSMPSYG